MGLVVVATMAVGRRSEPGTQPVPLSKQARHAPAFTVADLRGPGTVSLAQFRGRPVVLNFWASWCAPCLREMPAFEAVHQRVKDRIAFVGINHSDARQRAVELLAETEIRYPSGFDPTGAVAASYRLFGMPTTVFISPTGRILATHTGELSRTRLEVTLNELFGP